MKITARQRKRREKAARRKAKLLGIARSLPTPPGYTLHVELVNYDSVLSMTLQDAHGLRRALRVWSKRWKHVESLPAIALAKLLKAFEETPR